MTEPLSMDQVFIRKLTEIVQDNLSDENFNVKKLALEAGMSHTTLHRKLKAIKNQDASEFICEIRLQRAMGLLLQNAGTVSEIAFMVGFSSPTYFNKCFHEFYGYPPGEVKKRNLTQPELTDGTASTELNISDPKPSAMVQKAAVRMKLKRWIILVSTVALIFLVLLILFLFIPRFKEYNRSIVILPFKNLNEQREIQYVADGIMEDILNNLCRLSELRVISRITSEHFRGKNITAKEVARKVNARYILESSMRQFDDKARITVQLIDAYHDRHLWSENFDRQLTDILGIQGSIATQIALRLKDVIPGTEIKLLNKGLTDSPEAYDNYLRGRFLLYNADDEQRVDISKEGLIGSIEYFEKAIAADSNFAEAYAGMAKAYMSLTGWGWYKPVKEGFSKARELSAKALKIEPDLAQAHAVLGSVHFFGEHNFEEGRKEYLLALRANPPYPPVYQPYAQLLMVTGPIEEARVYMNRALELEPFYWVLHNLNAWIYYFEDKNKEAIEACHMARDLKSDYIFSNWLLFLNYAKLGDSDRAVDELKIIAQMNTGDDRYAAEILDASVKSGVAGLFKWLIDININRPVSGAGMSGHPFFIAWWNAILGNREESVYWLERNMEAKNKMFIYLALIATNPDFDILRNEARFLAIIDQIGLKPYHTRKAR